MSPGQRRWLGAAATLCRLPRPRATLLTVLPGWVICRQVSGGGSALLLLSVGCPGPGFPPPDADRLITQHCLHTDPSALQSDRQLLLAFRSLSGLLTGLSALAEAENASSRCQNVRRQSDPAPAQPWWEPQKRADRQPPPDPPQFDTLLAQVNTALQQLKPTFRLQLLEALYCVLFLSASDTDRSSADDQPSPPSPSGGGGAAGALGLPCGGARPLLTLSAQTALSQLLVERLTELTDSLLTEGPDGARLRRQRDRALCLVERHRRRLTAVEPFTADWPLSALLRAPPDTLLAMCWARGWLRHAALLTQEA
ncbi:hypothetical protein FJT64_024461 [Amphibalanus amphitrite]|uniref:Uncharacterized protein n=1 Tax=Amphibalanus amphitrite TaxID=1232801 RepID=A0A6A4WIA5_AMPAM|nr:hypothetical protein FJT64_024461 [Amphibalanus amphitrite]